MGLREREPWMRHIDQLTVPLSVKKMMRARVTDAEQTLSSVIGDLELLYLRLVQSEEHRLARASKGKLLQEIQCLHAEIARLSSALAALQAADIIAQQTIRTLKADRDANLAERAEHARLTAIGDEEDRR